MIHRAPPDFDIRTHLKKVSPMRGKVGWELLSSGESPDKHEIRGVATVVSAVSMIRGLKATGYYMCNYSAAKRSFVSKKAARRSIDTGPTQN
ncbi:hypothetical protein TNCV_4992701 [Trichonephila clavipes]|nr:hypothetical protein TNCV_4992701 [Trichonephila clavipes]